MDARVKPPVKKRRPFLLFAIGLLVFFVFLYLVFSFPPTYVISLGAIQLSLIIPVLSLLFFVLYAFGAFFFMNAVQGIAIAGVAMSYLVLSYFGLNQWIFIALLLGVFLSIEFAIYKKK